MPNDIRAVIFKEGDVWVAQGLEIDIGAQGSSFEEVRERFDLAFKLELRASLEAKGKAFAGIGQAPKHYFDLWDRHGNELVHRVVVTNDHEQVEVRLALCA